MLTSIIIPMLNCHDLTAACLASIEVHTANHEVILIDNGSDWSDQGTEALYESVTVRNPVNRGFAVACNQGARRANGDVLVFLNNDTEVTPGWLPPLLEALETHRIVQPLLIYPDGSVQCSGVEVDFSRPPGGEAWNLQGQPAHTVRTDAVTGACLAVRADVFDGFDEGFLNGYEDIDLCLTVGACAVVPASVVVHHESQSDKSARFGHAPHNIARLRDKHGSTK
jgi:GT2 family glycosyltransferase